MQRKENQMSKYFGYMYMKVGQTNLVYYYVKVVPENSQFATSKGCHTINNSHGCTY